MRFTVLFVVIWVGLARGSSDVDALLEFKKGIKEDPLGHVFSTWNRGDSPDSSGCPQNWYGVQCSGDRVSSITLNDMALVGNVSLSNFARMGMLRNLSLSSNQLMGILPSELGSASSLEFLDVSQNLFVGNVPIELTKMVNLVYLNLSSNNFGDGILGQLQSVVHVDLSQNQFSGSVKSIMADGSSEIISSLQYLNISHNKLSGELFAKDPMPLFDSLEVFDASFNQLSGHVPSFNFIVSLKILRLGNNQFSGSLPEALIKENSMVLTELDLSSNQLTGPVQSITSATLKNLNLSTNKLSGSLPIRVGSCAIVDLSNNMLSGNLSVVQSWGNYVEVIDLSSNKLTGTLPNETSQFLRLTSFKVSNNLLMGELPLVIGTYPAINVIDLSLNQLNGLLPPSLFTSSRLRDLNLSGNIFTGPIPLPNSQGTISTSTNVPVLPTQNSSLVYLDLSNNTLSGSLPQEIGELTALKLLNIGRNNISGQIPKEIGMLRSLLYIDLSNDHFEGTIPDNFPEGLVGFNVSYNNLSGIVPDNLLRFPDSSFHPGNDLLIFPHVPSSNVPNFADKGMHGDHKKNAVRYALIAGAIFLSVITVIILIYYRVSNAKRGKGDDKQKSPIPQLFGRWKSVDPPPASLSSSQDHLFSSRSASMPLEHGNISLTPGESAEPNIQGSSTKTGQADHATISSSSAKNEVKSSMSLIISSPPSDPYISQHPSIFSVCSPDRLAGDLHLFDNSFIFTAEELSRAPAEIIGRSCHGTSYKATLESGHVLTVKWLREGIAKSKKEFGREAKKLGNIRLPNIVSLRGYYWGPKEHERLIISDYIDAVSLTAHLCEFEQRKLHPLSLRQRLNIAVDTARCLDYLHNEKAIPHGNLKSTNILIQAPNLNAFLTDYSLHRIMNPAGMAEQVLNAGALGYRPPEFASTSKPCPSLKSDVYAFGVVLLELLTGKNAGEIVSGNPGIVDLTDWVKLLASENRSYECFDKHILEVDSAESPPRVLEDVLRVALRCIRSASERPEIRTIFDDLSSITF
ncbi:probable inactive receptor kinase At5g10020 isoform X2 [Phoenix dactylifera]|uniref:Probable inactive receptor kinase At5g10020 isoform X2 n=1 Tax=Phoenix dactylifera TaxID=42345 RepID=A0A8B7CHB0_PHODC|nr:probable inactive receptor kinase At5g10020 isoform X2 [Phoenix dactylifera]